MLKELEKVKHLNIMGKKSSAFGSGTSGMLGGEKMHESVVESKTDRFISKNSGWCRLL